MSIMSQRLKQFARFARKAKKDDEGTAAVEFAIIAMPFFALLFAIIELAVVFFLGSSLEGATFEASRQIRTGQFSGTEAQFEELVCEGLTPNGTASQIQRCTDRLDIRVRQLTNFGGAVAFNPVSTTTVCVDASGIATNFCSSSGGDTVLVSVRYRHTLSVPAALTRLSNVTDDDGKMANKRDIFAVSAFRNEPF